MPAGPSRGAQRKESLELQVSVIRVLPSNRRTHMGPSRKTGLRTTEAEADQERDDLRTSDQKRSRDVRFAKTLGATSARCCAAPCAEVWDVLRAENAESAGRIPRPARSVAPGFVDYASFVAFVGSGHLFTGRTTTSR